MLTEPQTQPLPVISARERESWRELAERVQARWRMSDFFHHAIAHRFYYYGPLLFILAGALWSQLAWGWSVAIASWLGLIYWSWQDSREKRPTLYAALQRWDEGQSRHELTSSAYLITHQSAPLTAAAALHLEKAAEALPQLQRAWEREIPLPALAPLGKNLAAVALCALGLHFVPAAFITPPATLNDAQRQALIDSLKPKPADEEKPADEDFLTTDEKKAAAALEDNLKKLQESLKNPDAAASSRDELEKFLRESEAHAREIEKDDDLWPSDDFNESLRSTPDTRALGQAMKQKNAESARQAAEELAQRLRDPKTTQEARERLRNSLEKAQRSRQADDAQRRAPQRLSEAEKKLKDNQANEAAQDFRQLSEDFQRQSRRQKHAQAQRDRQQRLRDSVEQFSNERQRRSRQKSSSAESAPNDEGKKKREPAPLPLMGRDGKKKPSRQIPGTGKNKDQNPIPGGQAAKKSKKKKSQAAVPVPGTKGDPRPGSTPDPNLTREKNSGLMDAEQADQIAIAPENEGESQTESQLGAPGEETSEEDARQLTRDFLRAEEKALDDSHLPPGQRTLVKRYFDSLHERLEK
jgi:hypothetical protein